jgi:hypothetical protein
MYIGKYQRRKADHHISPGNEHEISETLVFNSTSARLIARDDFSKFIRQ